MWAIIWVLHNTLMQILELADACSVVLAVEALFNFSSQFSQKTSDSMRVTTSFQVVLEIILFITSQAEASHPSLRQQLQAYRGDSYSGDNKDHIMYEKFLIGVANEALSSWTNSANQIKALRTLNDALSDENRASTKEINSLKDELNEKSEALRDWKQKYAQLRGEYENSVHESKKQVLSQQNEKMNIKIGTGVPIPNHYQIPIIAVSIFIILSLFIYPIVRYYPRVMNKDRIRTSIIEALPPVVSRKRSLSFKDTPDPLANVIVMNGDTPTNSTPTSPKASPISVAPSFFNKHDIRFEEEDVKISEIDIPNTIR